MKVFKHVARKDLYEVGLRIPTDNKQKYKLDRTRPADENDVVVIKKGQEYYSWHPKRCPWVYSLEPFVYVPPYNEWNEKIAQFEEEKNRCVDVEGLKDDVDTLRSEIEEYRDELQGRLDNMPDQLQESSVLNERIEELDGLISDCDDSDNGDEDEEDEDED